jgi:CRISPR-associated endonuclease/helicase Cas3
MAEYQVPLKPVYSQTVATPAEIAIPEHWRLAWHQLETFRALHNPDIDVVFNTALTGDGKSLAAYLPAMTGKNYTLAMYPTNELARDQEKQVQFYKTQFNPKYDPQIYRLNAALLEDFIETNQLPSKQAGLLNRADNSEILLTNPDIFHYIHDFRYLRRNVQGKGDNPDKVFKRIDDNYKLFVFDEFHILASPQIASILNSILLMRHTGGTRKFLFLSATPSEMLQEFLAKSGMRYLVINPASQGAYCYDSPNNTTQWRQISQPIHLTFPRGLQPTSQSSYEWITENAENTILRFFLNHPQSRGAIILNSIAAVKKLTTQLKPLFARHGLVVKENTGLTGESEKATSVEEADLLIGTSTIDVGVDFQINFLVFEAVDSGNFIQRLGRLGRHGGFSTYQAYALLPNFIVSRLFEKAEFHPLTHGETYDRPTLNNAVRQVYPLVNDFCEYPKRWGGIQSACIYSELKRMSHTYPQAAEGFGRDIQNALGISLKQQYGRIDELTKDGLTQIIEEARSFRGSSQLDCAIYDLTNPDAPESDRFKTYNLQGILSNFIYEWIERDEFIQKATSANAMRSRFQDALCYLKLTGYREVREDWRFLYPENLTDRLRLAKVQILRGLEVWSQGESINQISRSLSRRSLVCYISDRDPTELRARLGLPLHFQVYGLVDKYSFDDRRPPYSIAFGKSALLLETLLRFWKPKEDLGWIC